MKVGLKGYYMIVLIPENGFDAQILHEICGREFSYTPDIVNQNGNLELLGRDQDEGH